jgi:hypothetical protein
MKTFVRRNAPTSYFKLFAVELVTGRPVRASQAQD